jgi:uroporphyrin-III C-methyltransferase
MFRRFCRLRACDSLHPSPETNALTAKTTISQDGLAAALGLPAFEKGWVWLVGGGPGDPGLITALGAHAVAQADVILHDALINEALLALARPDAERIYAGKRAGVKSCKQSDISGLLVSLAREGKRVLRLKGGDPFVFGRGGEEAQALARAGIKFRIVPGVTAGIGGLAYAGIPVTHRDTNSAVTFITGHDAQGQLPALDWAALAKSSPTIVIYMARRNAGEIARLLMMAGRDGNEPAAIVSNAAGSKQSVIVTTLAGLGPAASESATPSILVIGRNVLLRRELDWLKHTIVSEAL